MKQIIILDTRVVESMLQIRAVFWFPVPTGAIPLALGRSAYLGATVAEVAALKDGTVVEEVKNIALPPSFSLAQIKATLVAAYTDRAAWLASRQPGSEYGISYDGTSWTS